MRIVSSALCIACFVLPIVGASCAASAADLDYVYKARPPRPRIFDQGYEPRAYPPRTDEPRSYEPRSYERRSYYRPTYSPYADREAHRRRDDDREGFARHARPLEDEPY